MMLQKQQLVKTKQLAELEYQETHIEEIALAISQEFGYSLQTINLLVKDLAAEYDVKLDNALKRFMVNEIDNFKHFAKLGQELESVTLTSERSREPTTDNQILDSLTSVRQTRKYLHQREDALNSVLENEFGRDRTSAPISLQKKHQYFLQNLFTSQPQVEAIQEENNR